MTSSLIYKYVIDKRLPLLLGIKEEEITSVESYSKHINFKRNGNKYAIRINKDEKGLSIRLDKDPDSDSILHSWPVTVIHCRGVQDDAGFEKFRTLLTEALTPIKVINCDE